MKSVREIYKTGKGPSSSHTMGPAKAVEEFLSEHPEAKRLRVVLYGSLAKTGSGHRTDRAIALAAKDCETEIVFDTEAEDLPHANTMDIFDADRPDQPPMRVLSVGGGDIHIEGRPLIASHHVYKEKSFAEIGAICKAEGIRLSDYVYRNEDASFREFLAEVLRTMKSAVREGLSKTGELPGGLGVMRKARNLFRQKHMDESPTTRENRIVCAYAFAISEQNADNGTIVTAPTCGACAVVPATLLYMQEKHGFSDDALIDALATGGLIGNLVKTNASISGAECGCQAEIGTACSMASAALADLFGMEIDQIEYAAEIAIEHHLGLTCDPIRGLVQIPCIERNAVAAMRAINAVSLANFLTDSRKISFDLVVRTMYETGRDLAHSYRETAMGGLAKLYE
ncbi:MAG: L-serine ammonia-lyase, iron-sulfur-dependent, subunit alpha [Clostridia bacterium]|nr:L-serine ammonia-lyase, iron-sulfur-dependent, subunit alpha [Clostridia bacterium]